MGVPQVNEKSEPGEWHLWLQREKGHAVIEKILGLMFNIKEPTKHDVIFGKPVTYWHWFGASKALVERYSETDIQTGQVFTPTDLNSWIQPLTGKIWDAYNYTMLVYCMKKVEQKAQGEAHGEILQGQKLMDLDMEVSKMKMIRWTLR